MVAGVGRLSATNQPALSHNTKRPFSLFRKTAVSRWEGEEKKGKRKGAYT